MPGIATEFLFTIALEVPVLALGEIPYGARCIALFAGGSFVGPKLRGKVLPGEEAERFFGATMCSILRFESFLRPTTSR